MARPIAGARILAALLAAGLAVPAGLAEAAEPYPSRPIKLIVPFPPGGPIDVMARFAAQRLSASIGSMIVENRPGAGGTLGAKAAANADPDGYTLMFGSSTTLAVGPSLYRNVGYDPVKSFAPIALISTVPFVLVVAPALPVKTVGELVAYAKANPGKVNFGAPTGTLPHLTGEWFKIATDSNIVHIPYKGAATAITDMLSSQIDMAFEPTSVLLAHIQNRMVRPLAITSATRGSELPDVPTMLESGVPGFVSVSWSGLVAPAGTPAAIVARLNQAINDSLSTPDARTSLRMLGAEARTGTPQDMAAFIAEETARWAQVVKSSGLKMIE
jgi:tripartite-type tricarboxylate transporter receptor subunit TctC